MTGGEAYFKRYLQLIEESREILHLQVYIFNNDRTGKEVQQALIRAASRGVKVALLLDGFGSANLPKKFLKKFEDAGIEVRFFSRLRFSVPFRMGRRLHHKLLVIDYHKAIVGGINVADRYRGTGEEQPWLDYAVYLEGPICIQLHEMAGRITKKRNLLKLQQLKRLNRLWKRKEKGPVSDIRILENDFLKNKLQIRRSYTQAIRSARHSLIIVNSYFLPSFKLLGRLAQKSRQGVEIALVLPHKSDVLFYNTAVKYQYRILLAAGIRIYEYPKAVLHAKVAAADNRWCTIGSYNLNDLSDLLSLELNIEIRDPAVAAPFQEELWSVIRKDCIEVSGSTYLRPSIFFRIIWKVYYTGLIISLRLLYWLTDKNRDYQVE